MEQARQGLNPQPAVLETAALPIELLAYMGKRRIAHSHTRALLRVPVYREMRNP